MRTSLSHGNNALIWCKMRPYHHGELILWQFKLVWAIQIRLSRALTLASVFPPRPPVEISLINLYLSDCTAPQIEIGLNDLLNLSNKYSTKCGRQWHWFTPSKSLLHRQQRVPHPDPRQDLLPEGLRSGKRQPACRASKECPEWLGQSSVLLAGFHHSTEGLGLSQLHFLKGQKRWSRMPYGMATNC